MRKNTKKKTKIFLCVFSVLAAIVLAAYGIYMGTTLSIDDVNRYTVEHSERNADKFYSIYPDSSDYAFFIAQNGDSSKLQEMFVFERLDLFNRYKLIEEVRSASDVGVYSYRSPDGLKYRMILENFVYFSDNQKDIGKCVYVVSTNGIEKTYEAGIHYGAFYFDLVNIGKAFNVTTKIINVKFYDRDGNLIEEFSMPNDLVQY